MYIISHHSRDVLKNVYPPSVSPQKGEMHVIPACYTSEQYDQDKKRLTRWLCGQPWAGADHAEDLAQDAIVAALTRQRSGLKPRALGWLCRDAAKRCKLLHDRSGSIEEVEVNGQTLRLRRKTPTRLDVEQQVDLTALMVPVPPQGFPDHLIDAMDLIQRVGSNQLQRAVQLVLAGAYLTEAAAKVGMPATSLRRALRLFGRKIKRCQRTGRSQAPDPQQQMDMFVGTDQGV
jgi:DNA-directed RNA polymerase specialized sigma24 family protein